MGSLPRQLLEGRPKESWEEFPRKAPISVSNQKVSKICLEADNRWQDLLIRAQVAVSELKTYSFSCKANSTAETVTQSEVTKERPVPTAGT